MIKYTMIFILLLPLAFQLLFGNKALKGHLALSFWQVSLISVFGQIVFTVCNLLLISEVISRSGSRDGLPFIGMLVLELLAGSILLLFIFIQGYIQHRKSKSKNDNR